MNETTVNAEVVKAKPAGQVAIKGLAGLLKQDGIMDRVQALLGERAPQFTSSLLSLTNSSRQLCECDPKSVLASAMVAATLDLPINPNLGFAYIIPYGQVAQFQMGYKGFIQLAMRTGQYQRMNAVCVNAEAIAGTDDVGEPIIIWDKIDESKPVVGYVFAFKLVNGYTKVAYWTKAKVEAHATRYSQAYKAKKKDSPWMTNFDSQGLKTVIKNTLAKWGILSVEMQKAIEEDSGTRKELSDDAPPLYLDNAIDIQSTVTTEAASAPSIADRAKAASVSEPAAFDRDGAIKTVKTLMDGMKSSPIKAAMEASGLVYEDDPPPEMQSDAVLAKLIAELTARTSAKK
jgi:recombination protein RecT